VMATLTGESFPWSLATGLAVAASPGSAAGKATTPTVIAAVVSAVAMAKPALVTVASPADRCLPAVPACGAVPRRSGPSGGDPDRVAAACENAIAAS